MNIRQTQLNDLNSIMQIYAEARESMRANGNPEQWKDGYPPEALIREDIARHCSYLCENDSEVLAVFYYQIEAEADYDQSQAVWLNSAPYGVVHRIAVKKGTRAVGSYCLNWAFEQCGNLKIDTHEANIPMRGLLRKLGFAFCGRIRIMNGAEERLAFQKQRTPQQDK